MTWGTSSGNSSSVPPLPLIRLLSTGGKAAACGPGNSARRREAIIHRRGCGSTQGTISQRLKRGREGGVTGLRHLTRTRPNRLVVSLWDHHSEDGKAA